MTPTAFLGEPFLIPTQQKLVQSCGQGNIFQQMNGKWGITIVSDAFWGHATGDPCNSLRRFISFFFSPTKTLWNTLNLTQGFSHTEKGRRWEKRIKLPADFGYWDERLLKRPLGSQAFSTRRRHSEPLMLMLRCAQRKQRARPWGELTETSPRHQVIPVTRTPRCHIKRCTL